MPCNKSRSIHAPLHRPELERDACGVAMLADAQGRASHELLEHGLLALSRLAHRGGKTVASNAPPDGAGVLTAIPWTCLARDLPEVLRTSASRRAAGVVFAPPGAASIVAPLVERILEAHGWSDVRWRRVPVDPAVLTRSARENAPEILQVFAVAAGDGRRAGRRLYNARLKIEQAFRTSSLAGASVVSLSTRTIIYKGLLAPDQLAVFYPDLRDRHFITPLCIVHQRFSTNTLPRWELAQPFRMLAHNGEINTIAGNRLWMRARQADPVALPGLRPRDVGPVVPATGSDSQSLDAAVELLWQAGYELPHALARLVPPAWEHDETLAPEERAFFQYQACASEPWDGPAAIAFTDGRLLGALLDRNGFRPARFVESTDRQLLLGSEAGIFDVPDRAVARRGRLGPGDMIVLDLDTGRLSETTAVRRALARRRPYASWIRRAVLPVDDLVPAPVHGPAPAHATGSAERLVCEQALFGYTREELQVILRPMALDGHEAVGSMGDDTPLAALSRRPRLLPDYFRQRFAQVTNPPMDPFREAVVMSLQMVLGARESVLTDRCPRHPLVLLDSPVLSSAQLAGLHAAPEARATTIPLHLDVAEGKGGLRKALDRIAGAAHRAVTKGAAIVVLSDDGCGETRAPVPPLLATAAVHQALAERGCRMRCSLVVDTGEARDAHQVATLLAFGAAAVHPRVGNRSAAALATGAGGSPAEGEARYRRALEEGLLKIFSKMGISTCAGYCGGQLFEVLGLESPVAALFPGAVRSLDGGAAFEDLAGDALARHRRAFAPERVELDHPGMHSFRQNGEYHANHPALVRQLHAVANTASAEAYERFAALVDGRPPAALRDLLEFRASEPIPLEEVESVEALCRRFFASAMSVGALSPEAHRAIAVALNSLRARSNSGEGGEEPERARPVPGQPLSASATKQVASARFGVTPEYLITASEIQIKMAQGSKPGEGGQLPASKVVGHIARLRHAQPGIPLISPPPHHDIYSIEDLAQLIYDLRRLHPVARINVKLVAQAGVGIVAAGVAKAGADAIQISGHDGGTGASPRGSIKHAGLPWELGLAEAHQVLTLNGLRQRVVLQTDGGLKTGRDVAVAAALGADEFGFGTALLVATGCVMARQCHLNTCPVGIATQRPNLRAKFTGTPEMIVSYLRLLAADVRAILARLGLRGMAELTGRADLLERRAGAEPGRPGLDLTPLLVRLPATATSVSRGRALVGRRMGRDRESQWLRDVEPALGRSPVTLAGRVRNTDRAVGARIAGAIAARFGDAGVPGHPVRIRLAGSAGQSFGAFLLPGMELRLIGEANDYVGKGMHGGLIVIQAAPGPPEAGVLAGNTVLYGATGGRVFIGGSAGERFAVRNSGAVAVVEGVGDHACEYMTGGLVVVLGRTGRNFAAGMSGGLACVFDADARFDERWNREMVDVSPLDPPDEARLHELLLEHAGRTGSRRAAAVLDGWTDARRAFRKVAPKPVAESSAGIALAAVPAARA